MHIFLDESGQFHKNDSEDYFVIGSFTVGDHKRTKKRFKSWSKDKFPKKIRFRPEIKFSDSGISDELRIKTVKFISKLDVRIRFSFLKRQNIPEEYKRKEKIQTGLLYTKIVAETLEMYTSSASDLLFHVFCDQRKLKGVSKKEFVNNIKIHLLPSLPSGANIKIERVNSRDFPNVQLADWIVGVIASYLNKKPLGEELFGILQNNILAEGREMFKDYWENKFNNQKTQSGD
ncbi:MAG: DUF3800 domain-containing protein [Candidatus Magasanikbacteria bacterium]|nr:DUF3800 domain-containing protein [Candidatus Magasanikbacteria bacterium]